MAIREIEREPFLDDNLTLALASTIRRLTKDDPFKVKQWSDRRIRSFLTAGRRHDRRDAIVWGLVRREARRRKLAVIPKLYKYDFF